MSLADSVIPQYSGSKTKARQWILKTIRSKRPSSPTAGLLAGQCVFIPKYVAVTAKFWDYNPAVLIIRSGSKYVFGINLNWLSRMEKRRLLELLKRWKVHENSRLKNAGLFRQLKRYRFTRSAYRLYFRSQIAKSRIFKLENAEMFTPLYLNLLAEHKQAKNS